MTVTRRKLPTGVQTFRKIREGDFYYVDKTPHVLRLIESGSHYFLSRPRRFGKSLLVDTIKELFEGSEALFRGLHVHDRWDWSVHHTVVRLDFGGGDFREAGSLGVNLGAQFDELERDAPVEYRYDGFRSASATCCVSCTALLASGWWCWWTSTTSRCSMR